MTEINEKPIVLDLEDHLDPSYPTLSRKIMEAMAEKYCEREVGSGPRCSMANYGLRRQWLEYHKIPSTPMRPNRILTFLYGSFIEGVIQWAIRDSVVGPDKFYSEINFGEIDETKRFLWGKM